MANKKNTNGHKPVTKSELNIVLNKALNKALKPIWDKLTKHDKRFEYINGRFEQIDKRFDIIETRFEMNDRRYIVLNARVENLEKSVNKLNDKFEEYFTKMYSHIDAFMKRTESNERETLFLGKQHDDLAKYCSTKIGYPTYGRNL